MRYTVILERGEAGWSAYVPDLPGCVAAGRERDETLALIREAIEFHVDGLKREGAPVPEPASESEVVEIGAAR
ncbi:MAG: type II toxin-antitoxin system HicB family antitoxin [Actinomycetota bacterium]